MTTSSASVVRTVRADRRHNDQVILAAAARLLAADPAVSTRDIADAAGVARPTLYRHFPTREALEAGVHEAVQREMSEALDERGSWDVGAPALRRLVVALASVGLRYPFIFERHQIRPIASPVEEPIIAFLAAGQRAAVLRTDIPAEALNAMLFGTLSSLCGLMPDAAPEVVGALAANLVMDGAADRP